jgi:lactoylglutathione lyase
MTLKGLRFGHVAFRVTDIERSLGWYREAFGAEVVAHVEAIGPKPEYYYAEFATGQMVEFFVNGRTVPEPAPDAAGFAHLCLVVDDIQEALAHMTAIRATISRPYFEGRAGQKVFFVADPDGNQIEIMEIRPDSPIHRA